jgi:hypothetical protein
VPPDHGKHIEQVEANHRETLPQLKTAVGEETNGETDSNDEEANISDEGPLADLELTDQGHGTGDDSSDKAGRSYQLTNSHATTVGSHGGKSAENIWRAVAKGQEGHAG